MKAWHVLFILAMRFKFYGCCSCLDAMHIVTNVIGLKESFIRTQLFSGNFWFREVNNYE